MKKRILKILSIVLITIIALVAVLAVRHYFMSKSDRELFADAYGEYYTTPDGERINYTFYDSESDKVAVLLPGFGSSSAHYEFDTIAKGLNDAYKIIIVDPLGVGLSDETDRERSVSNYCEELHGLMTYLGYDHYTLIGHSIAGLYALDYSNRYPEEVDAFIGIDASIPHMIEICPKEALPDNMYKSYKSARHILVDTGLYRVLTELSYTKTAEMIPTLSEDDKKIYLALNCTDQLNDTQLREIGRLSENIKLCYDEKFPESVPVLYLLSNDNNKLMPGWDELHRKLITNPSGQVIVLEGGHYLHLENSEGIISEILKWTNSLQTKTTAKTSEP
ncbi:MAG: alpha/beta hydrolase [Eubacterium sp.]|nr:alpha/beta hydrolase [Eubacterium sp.]